jgi:hypothetical protein
MSHFNFIFFLFDFIYLYSIWVLYIHIYSIWIHFILLYSFSSCCFISSSFHFYFIFISSYAHCLPAALCWGHLFINILGVGKKWLITMSVNKTGPEPFMMMISFLYQTYFISNLCHLYMWIVWSSYYTPFQATFSFYFKALFSLEHI